jgi:2-C-methyl-D-erythritol 4-phosphate cytidylyltransferase
MNISPMKIIRRVVNKGGKRCSAVIVAAGSSRRMKGVDKLYVDLGGKPLLARTLQAFDECDLISEIVLVVSADKKGTAARLCSDYPVSKLSSIVTGGSTRAESSNIGVKAVSKRSDLIAIHDGARPLVTQQVIKTAIESAAVSGTGVPALPVSSTLKKVESGTVASAVDRTGVFEIQTPQVFQADLIRSALKGAADCGCEITDDSSAAEMAGIPINITQGSPENIKITTPGDLEFAELILRGRGEVK